MPFLDPDEAFDYGLQRVSIDYDSDDGNTYRASCRKAYADITGFVTPATSNVNLPRGRTMRHLFLEHTNDDGVKIRRSFPIAKDQLAIIEQGADTTMIVDGILFNIMGFDGESNRYSNTKYVIAP